LDIEDTGADLGILEEHFVEITEAEKQDSVWDPLLDAQILRDERCALNRHLPPALRTRNRHYCMMTAVLSIVTTAQRWIATAA
jgi:hypothetical protein